MCGIDCRVLFGKSTALNANLCVKFHPRDITRKVGRERQLFSTDANDPCPSCVTQWRYVHESIFSLNEISESDVPHQTAIAIDSSRLRIGMISFLAMGLI